MCHVIVPEHIKFWCSSFFVTEVKLEVAVSGIKYVVVQCEASTNQKVGVVLAKAERSYARHDQGFLQLNQRLLLHALGIRKSGAGFTVQFGNVHGPVWVELATVHKLVPGQLIDYPVEVVRFSASTRPEVNVQWFFSICRYA
jgi:hypothetical protein